MNALIKALILFLVILSGDKVVNKQISDINNKNPLIYHDTKKNCILKIFTDSSVQFGAQHFCTIEYFLHLGGGYYAAKCYLDNDNIVIYNNNNEQKSTAKITCLKGNIKPNEIELLTNADNIPYQIYFNNKMQTIHEKRFIINASKDTIDLEVYFKDGYSETVKLASKHTYRIEIKDAQNLRQIDHSYFEKLKRGYIKHDSIFFIQDGDSMIFTAK